MTLREMIAAHPEKFYAGQTWFEDEAFMDVEPTRVNMVGCGFTVPGPPRADLPSEPLHSAADMALHWLKYPEDQIWAKYLWASDTDSLGQRVFVGQNGSGLEIHRHLRVTDRWVVPL